MFRQLSAPISVQWELTPTCNLNCLHCYNYWRDNTIVPLNETRNHVGAQYKDLIAQELIKHQVFHVTLTGGEPLLVLEDYLEPLLRLRDVGIEINLNSNLNLLDAKMINLLKAIGVKSILTSLMSFDHSTHDFLANTVGAFKASCDGIEYAIQEGFRVAVNMVVSKKNANHVVETGMFVKSLGVQAFCATKASKPLPSINFGDYQLTHDELQKMFIDLLEVSKITGLDVDSLEHYPACIFPDSTTRSLIGGRNCSAGKTGCTVGFDGMVRPCSHADQSYGNIINGLENAWGAMSVWRDGTLIPNRCKEFCKEFPVRCGGGCRVEASNCNGALSAEDPYCNGHVPPTVLGKVSKKFSQTTVFKPSRILKFRTEKIGQISYVSVKNWLWVDDLLKAMLQRDSFTMKDLATLYQVELEEVIPTIRLLLAKKLVRIDE